MPVDIDAWQRRVIGGCTVRSVERTETLSGWPVTLIRSDEMTAEGTVRAARLHALYTLIDRGCVASVQGEAAVVDGQRAALLDADVDWTTDTLLALVELWQV